MKTLEKTQTLNLLDIDGLTDLSDENAASCCGGVTTRFLPSGDSIGGGGFALTLYDRSLFNADASDKPGTGSLSTRGHRVEIDAAVGETVSFASTGLDNQVSTAISVEGAWRLAENADGSGGYIDIGPGVNIAAIDFATGGAKRTGPGFFNTGQAGTYDNIFSSVTRIA